MAPAGGLDPSFQTNQERAPMRLPIIFAVAAAALAGCNANQPPNASAHWAFSGESAIQDPIHQAQTSGFYAGR
jgi:hypothetical protein